MAVETSFLFQYAIIIIVFFVGEMVAIGLLYNKPSLVRVLLLINLFIPR